MLNQKKFVQLIVEGNEDNGVHSMDSYKFLQYFKKNPN